MKSLIIFEVKNNRYAIDLEYIQRIAQIPKITDIPNAHEYVDGMMSYKQGVIKVVNFRKMTNLDSFDSDLKMLFLDLKEQHTTWVQTLKNSVEKGVEFDLATDAHACNLGQWLDGFTSYDERVSTIVKELNSFHKQLHKSAISILETAKYDQDKALKEINESVMSIYNSTIHQLDQFMVEFDVVSDSLQKLLLYHGDECEFALKVDAIIDIAHVDKAIIKESEANYKISPYLELEGVIELDSVLVNMVKSIKLPIKEVS
ncbi:MAG: chemotaxis protein CheW [Campylobacterota bacterium]|nr:chemotaxis protein CheW [Campylobacterota bacterium]